MHGFDTRAIHAGQEPDPLTGAVVPPIYQVSTFAQDGVGGLRGGYEYSRSANPTRTALQECLASLEAPDQAGARAMAFASGLAAEDTLLRTVCRPGDHAVIPDDAYGGTYRLFAKVAAPWGLDFTPAPVTDPEAIAAAILPGRTKVVWIETPTNPLLNIADIAAVADVAHAAGAILVVDNTFASPYLQQPLLLGADVVVHSTTKYLGGHSDVVGGALVTADAELGDLLAYNQNAMGSVPGPFDSLARPAGDQDPRPYAWIAIARTPGRSSTSWSGIRGWPRCAGRGSSPIRGTRSQHVRCVTSAAWCRSGSRAARALRSMCADAPRCSPWVSHWAESSR